MITNSSYPTLDLNSAPQPGHVLVSSNTEDALLIGKTGGKKRAPKGLPHLPGGKFGRPLWEGYWKSSVSGKQAERMRKDISMSGALDRWNKQVTHSNPSLNPVLNTVGTLPSKSDYDFADDRRNKDFTGRSHSITARSNSSDSSNSTRASSSSDPHSGGKRAHSADPKIDVTRHAWYHRAVRDDPSYAEKERAMQAALIKKSKNHIGYGNGMIGYGDVQATSLDKESPSWMFGMRMVSGVVGSGFPRWQYCMVEDGKLNTQPRYFERGPNLSTIETIGGAPPSTRNPTPAKNKLDINRVPDKRASSLIGPGAICKKPIFPPSSHKTQDPDHRIFYKVDRY